MVGENDGSLIAILIGAQEFPKHSALDKKSFGLSNDAILGYIQDYLSLGAEQILNLFDDPASVIELDERIIDFLSKYFNAKNIIVFYIGHGGFLLNREYYLTTRCTAKGREHTTGLRISTLAHTLSSFIGEKNLFLILDCCFAGEAVRDFQSAELAEIVDARTFDALPQAGTALLVASSKDEPAIAPNDQQYTMFSEALLKVLREGIPGKPERLTLHEVAVATQAYIKAKYGGLGVRPEVHSPRQRGINIADLQIFPNLAPKFLHPAPARIKIDAPIIEGLMDGEFLPGNGKSEWFQDHEQPRKWLWCPQGSF